MKTLTDQQKLEILCAYLPHGVEVEITIKESGITINPRQRLSINNIASLLPINPRPVLRHPDDMTEEELKHLANNWGREFGESILADETPMYLSLAIDCLNYLHSIHIDTFDAIEAGFAVRKNINEKG